MFKWFTTSLEINEENRPVLLAQRAFYKWILDFLRNLVMIAALSYVAAKSGSWFVWSIAIIAGFALCGHCYTYVEMIGPKSGAAKTWRNAAAVLLIITVLQLSTTAISVGMFFAIDRIVKAQLLYTGK